MVQAPSKTLKLAEFLQLPGTKPASEYINGQVIQKPMPQGKHSAIQGEFVSAVNGIVKPKRIARAFPIPKLRCTFGGHSTVPDIAVFTWSRIPRDQDLPYTHKSEPESFQPPKSPNSDVAGELFRNIVRMAEGTLNPPILGDFEFMLPQSWGLGGRKKPPPPCQYFQVLN